MNTEIFTKTAGLATFTLRSWWDDGTSIHGDYAAYLKDIGVK